MPKGAVSGDVGSSILDLRRIGNRGLMLPALTASYDFRLLLSDGPQSFEILQFESFAPNLQQAISFEIV